MLGLPVVRSGATGGKFYRLPPEKENPEIPRVKCRDINFNFRTGYMREFILLCLDIPVFHFPVNKFIVSLY